MKRAGFFSDRPLSSIRVGRGVRDHLGGLDLRVQSLVASYLARGTSYITMFEGVEPDVVDPSMKVKTGILTDGEWLWPTGYAHYVKTYGVEVPAELIEKIESLKGVCPEVTKDDLSRVGREFRAWGNAADPNFSGAWFRGSAR